VTGGPNSNLLQALEHTLEGLRRTTEALTRALNAMERGERFSDTIIADYRSQLDTVDRDRLRMEEMVRALWSHVERRQ
jgi:hypothetical protein